MPIGFVGGKATKSGINGEIVSVQGGDQSGMPQVWVGCFRQNLYSLQIYLRCTTKEYIRGPYCKHKGRV